MKKLVDVAIIGAGTAGISAFKEASKITKNIILIDQSPLGTTCAHVGCMPSKAFIQTANYYHDRHYLTERGITHSEQLKVNIPNMMRHVRKMRDDFTSGIINYIESLNDQFIIGKAEIDEPNVIKIDKNKITAKKIIIATGSHSFVPSEWNSYSEHILTSENFFEQINFSKKMGILGAGVIGLELGQALSRLGIAISIFDSDLSMGKLTDPEVNEVAIHIMQQEFPLYLNHKAQLEKTKDLLLIKSEKKFLEVNQVLAALGRRSNLSDINFDKLGIKTDESGIPLFDNTTMQIKNSDLFIAGDISKERQLLHEAADEGRIAGYNAVHENIQCFNRRIPLSIIFTEPNIAIVGQSFSSIKNIKFITGKASFENQGRSRIMSKNKGILHVYAEQATGKLLGAEMIAPAGEHLAHMLAWAIQYGLTAFDVLKMPYYHPTIEEGMRSAIRDVANQVKSNREAFDMTMCDSEAVTTLS